MRQIMLCGRASQVSLKSPDATSEQVPSSAKTASDEASTEIKVSPEVEASPRTHIVLSLTDDFYKETMWRYYRILGRTRDHDKEVATGNDIFTFFKRCLQGERSGGKFFKRNIRFGLNIHLPASGKEH